MRIVLDTNVLVSGLLRPFGAPGRLVRLIPTGDLVPCFDARILLEYREVLARDKFGFDTERVEALLVQVASSGSRVQGAAPLAIPLPDPDDEVFLEVAVTAGAEALVTGNLRHFPEPARAGIEVLSPAELVGRLRQRELA